MDDKTKLKNKLNTGILFPQMTLKEMKFFITGNLENGHSIIQLVALVEDLWQAE